MASKHPMLPRAELEQAQTEQLIKARTSARQERWRGRHAQQAREKAEVPAARMP
jgi:hypothetical protein